MGFYIRKSVGIGSVRFNVAQRRTDEEIGTDPRHFSTGSGGEYQTSSGGGLYFHEELPVDGTSRKIKGEKIPLTGRQMLERVLMGVGVLLILIGIAVVMKKGPAGYVEIVIGLAMVIAPPIINAKQRADRRAAEEKIRAERAEIEKRNSELAASFAAKVRLLDEQQDAAALEAVRQEREAADDVPYAAIRKTATAAAIAAGFRALTRFDKVGSRGLANELDDTISAVGLDKADSLLVKKSVYQKAVWDMLADDRLSAAREGVIREIGSELRLTEVDVAIEKTAIEEFRKLKGVTKEKVLIKNPPVKLAFQETCHHVTSGSLLKPGTQKKLLEDGTRTTEQVWTPAGDCKVIVTSRRVIVDGKGGQEITFANLKDVELDGDQKVLALTAEGFKTPLYLSVPDPIFTGSMIGLASSTGEKRPGFFNN
ncbi:MAG TPA: hypothetical protein VNM92_16215 [Thermoanaerobaculia bacterium]|nr:hypothetical protein [Thermoanaerobaculia bacterium]